MFKNTIKAAALAVAAAMIAAAAPAGAADKLKVGYVYVGPVGDLGYSYQHDVGRLALQKALGDKVETTFVENVPEGADAERVIAQLAQSGHGLIFTTSFGFMNPTIKVAQRFPKVKFEHATGYKRANNVATYSARFHEGRTVIGAIAGKMTKSGKIGYIASFPIPEVVSGINAFTLALKKVRPDAEVSVVWVNSWYDPGKEAEAAKALIAQGADVLSQHTDSPAPVQAAEAAGIYAFGQSSDMAKFGPKAHLTSITDDWDGYYINRAKAVLDGTWKSEDTWGGLDSGMVVLSPYNPGMPKDVAAMADQIKNDLIAHKITSFDGPFKNRDGKEVIPAGQHLNDQQILTMNYFVEGVKGDLPK